MHVRIVSAAPYIMYKIEFQYWDERLEVPGWRKGKHKLYESEKAFKTYWEYHKQDYNRWGFSGRRLVGFKDSKQICIAD